MLIDFTLKNFMAYRDEVSLSMIASNTVRECESSEGGCSNVTLLNESKRVLRSAAIYGANGSGKSSIIAAIDIFKSIALKSFVDENIVKYLSDLYFRFDLNGKETPVSMQMIFINNSNRYRFGFEVKAGKVIAEWLFVLSEAAVKESYCYKRENSNIKINPKTFKGASGIASKTRSNSLFLSTAAQFNVAVAMDVKEWFRKRLHILSGLDDTMAFTAKAFMYDAEIRKQILEMIGIVDSCIKGVDVKEHVKELNGQPPLEVLSRLGITLPSDQPQKIEQHELEISATHDVFDNGEVVGNERLKFRYESLGTNKLFALLGPFFDTISKGGVLIIDEFGVSLHTKLSMELLRLFHSVLNQQGAQLIVTTHDTNLLRKDLLRRDQIWFTEKDSEGSSDLYSLVEYKINQANSVRNDASFSRDYLLGRYGAIPYFGNIDKFVMEYGKNEE